MGCARAVLATLVHFDREKAGLVGRRAAGARVVGERELVVLDRKDL
jgi:hypothetical protein